MTRNGAPRGNAWWVVLRAVLVITTLTVGFAGSSWAAKTAAAPARMPPGPRQAPPPKPPGPPPPGSRGPSVVLTVQVINPQVSFRNWLEVPMPNPVITSTTIRYTCVRTQRVTIKLFDITGQKVATLLDQVQGPGAYSLWWDGRGNKGIRLASGVYFCRMESPGFMKVQKFVMSR